MHYPAFIKCLLWIIFDFTIRKCCGSQLPDIRVSHLNKCWQKDRFFTRRSGISLQQCVQQCDNRPKCKSITYRSNVLLCELIPTISNGNATVDGPCTIVNKNDSQSQNHCNCTDLEVCNPEIGNCSIKECAPFTITNGTFSGNMNIIGSRVKFTCNPGTIESREYISTCLINGTWSVYPQCTPDVNECVSATDTCDDNAVCENTQGSYTCTCQSGYKGDGVSCTDENECDAGTTTCDVNAVCENTQGSYTCTCTSGYTGDGQSCTDVNECHSGTSTCHVKAVCENTQSSYTCTCKSGYTGDGESCTDINECDAATDTCDDNAVCENTQGSYTCTCKSGYTGDGQSCTDINECVTETSNCVENAECENTEGSYTCFCNKNTYTGPCPPYFVNNKGSCYLVGYDILTSWNSAMDYCRDKCGAHLVHIDDEAENTWIASQLNVGDYWINLSDSLEEGQWIWYDTGIEADYTYWGLLEPNSWSGNEDCAVYTRLYGLSYWLDVDCEWNAKPFCELE